MGQRKADTLHARILRFVFEPTRIESDHDTKSIAGGLYEGTGKEYGRERARLRAGEIHRAGVFQIRLGPVVEGENGLQTVYSLTDDAKHYGYRWALARVNAHCVKVAAERKEALLKIESIPDEWERVVALVDFRERGVTAASLAAHGIVSIEAARFVVRALRRTILGRTVRGRFFKDKRWTLMRGRVVAMELRANPHRTKFTIEAAPKQHRFSFAAKGVNP